MEEIKEANKPERVEKRQEKIKNWLKDRHNLLFLGILVLATIIRLQQFSLTSSQALWWDEADYLAYAKNLAGFDVGWTVTSAHNSLFPYLIALLFKLGLNEAAAKFVLVLIPSLLLVVLAYKIGKLMYKDKRIALIAASITAALSEVLFNTTRFHVDVPGLFFALLAVYVFWKGHEKKEKVFNLNHKWTMPLVALFIILTYSTRRGYFLFGIFFFIHLLLTKNWKVLLKDKYNWISLGVFVTLFFLVEQYIFINQIAGASQQYIHTELPINLLPLGIFNSFFAAGGIFSLGNIWLYLFWIGLVLVAGKLVLSLGHIGKSAETKSDLFNMIIIVITLTFFILVLRTPNNLGEPRWYLPLALSAFIFVSKASVFITELIKPYNKHIAIIFLVVLVALGGYYQYNRANTLIRDRIDGFTGIRDISLLLKQISEGEDRVLTLGQPQVEYYSERETVNARLFVDAPKESEENFVTSMERIEEEKDIRFLLISFSESGYPIWARRVTQDTWEIPFMQTRIDFATGEQQINREGSFGNLTFRLVDIKQEAFLYEIIRN